MTKKPDPTYDPAEAEHGSVQEPDGAEWPMDDAFVDAFIERNREELIRSLERARRDFDEGRGIPLEVVDAEIDEMLRALEAGE
jgi:hypothetical protein